MEKTPRSYVRQDIATRALVVAWKSPVVGKSAKEIERLTGVPFRQVERIYAKAIRRGFNPHVRPIVIKVEHLSDAPKPGRPTRQKEENVSLGLVQRRAQGNHQATETNNDPTGNPWHPPCNCQDRLW